MLILQELCLFTEQSSLKRKHLKIQLFKQDLRSKFLIQVSVAYCRIVFLESIPEASDITHHVVYSMYCEFEHFRPQIVPAF